MPTQPPPDIPSKVPHEVAEYLRRLNAWAYQELDRKVPKDEAVPAILLSASDQKNPTAVFRLTVNAAGNFVGTQVPLGGGKP